MRLRYARDVGGDPRGHHDCAHVQQASAGATQGKSTPAPAGLKFYDLPPKPQAILKSAGSNSWKIRSSGLARMGGLCGSDRGAACSVDGRSDDREVPIKLRLAQTPAVDATERPAPVFIHAATKSCGRSARHLSGW